jgi:hypothetical protein
MFSNEQWLANSGANFYNGVATQSLRFDDGRNTELTRSPSGATDQKKYTLSCWVKRGNLGSTQTIFGAGDSGTGDPGFEQLNFTSGDALRHYRQIASNGDSEYVTNRLFRDTSAWYHIVVMMDAVNTLVKIYINGVRETSFSTTDHPANRVGAVNSTQKHVFGNRSIDGSADFDGYLAEVNFLDGLLVGETDGYLDEFGELKNGVWIPKEYTGSYGTNGFRLQFDQVGVGTASASTIGADTSGNTNHWTSSGIVASDCAMPDSPENSFCTMNPLDIAVNFALSEGNTKLVAQSNAGLSRSTLGMSTGKGYFEFIYTDLSGDGLSGITNQEHPLTSHVGANPNGWGYRSSGQKFNNTTSTSYGASYTTGDVIGVAFDADNGNLVFYKNNASQGTAFTGLASDTYFASFGDASTADASTMIANFGQDSSFAGNKTAQGNTDGNGIGDFYYEPPSGFLALCTSNLPEPTIGANSLTQADDHFNTVLYTGNGVNSVTGQDISGVGFKPDWLWIKRRDLAASHNLRDSTRGVLNHLQSDGTGTEDTESDVGVTAFLDDGFRLLGTNAGTGQVNANNGTYVAWNWKANGGTTSSNTDGSITSTVQANTDAGFSIVTYTGNSTAGATVGHGLSFEPNVMLVKCRSDSSSDDHWFVYHSGIASDPQNWEIYLNLSLKAYQNNSYPWNSTAPTSSVFTLGSSPYVNETAETYVSYLFHSVEGYSKFGSYIGNSNADGIFVYTGFRPAWVIVKAATGAVQHWWMFDNKRKGYNVDNDPIYANLTAAEETPDILDFVSNGFKMRTSSAVTNASGVTYIYMAFGDSTKYANAR